MVLSQKTPGAFREFFYFRSYLKKVRSILSFRFDKTILVFFPMLLAICKREKYLLPMPSLQTQNHPYQFHFYQTLHEKTFIALFALPGVTRRSQGANLQYHDYELSLPRKLRWGNPTWLDRWRLQFFLGAGYAGKNKPYRGSFWY